LANIAEEGCDRMRMTDIKSGWEVVGNDGRRVGTVREVSQNYVVVSTTVLTSDLYVPASAIANVADAVIHLSAPQRDVAEMGWAQAPRDDEAPTTSPETELHRHV